jgi:hypothetical protein
MTVNATAVWRVRPGGSNTNGGGFDCGISSAATGTHGSLSGVTFTDATAAAFTSGMAGSAINISGVGQFKIATYVSATQITLAVGAGGSLPQLSGGASWMVGAGQDYSQQNAAQASGSAGTATGTTTFTDAVANAFTLAMVGNAIWIASGAGFTVGAYFVTAYTSASQITLDRSPGTGTAAVWTLGGSWADPWTNMDTSGNFSTLAVPKPGNKILILGSGIPNPASYSFDYVATNYSQPTSGNVTDGYITYANDPATPGYKPAPDTTGGMPCIKTSAINSAIWYTGNNFKFEGLWVVLAAATGTGPMGADSSIAVVGCVFDQFGFDQNVANSAYLFFIGSEVFSSVAPVGVGGSFAVSTSDGAVIGSNIHDTVGGGIALTGAPPTVSGSIIAKCSGTGIIISNNNQVVIINNTIDGNLGNGIEWDNGGGEAQNGLSVSVVTNNIISNHTQAGKAGLKVDAGTVTQNDRVQAFVDYNVYYNNTTDVNAISYGPHDTHGGSNPYVGQPTENYTLA